MKPELTHGQAASWALSVLLAFMIVGQNVASLTTSKGPNLVLAVGVQVVVYLSACALFSARRPGRTFEELFALRRTSVSLLLVGFLLGLALRAPADFMEALIQKVAPFPKAVEEELAKSLVPHGVGHGIALALAVSLCGPFVEELLYRGALFTALRRTAGAVSTTITTGILFAVVHFEPRYWPPIFALAGCIGFLRAASGSLWPGFLLHAAFNGTAVGMTFIGEKADAFVQRPVFVGGSVVAAGLLMVLVARLARGSALAERARLLDVQPPPAPEATS